MTMAEYLMTSAVMDHQSSYAGEIWESLPSSWKTVPSIYCIIIGISLRRFICNDVVL